MSDKKLHRVWLALLLLSVVPFLSCVSTETVAYRTPLSPKIQILSEINLKPSEYEVKGIVTARRRKIFFDMFGLIKLKETMLGELSSECITFDVTPKAIALGANAIADIKITATYIPGCLIIISPPFGVGMVTVRATAIKIK
ncbi:hypothetical protein GF338_01190 [candidate division WOR-3 bacterium]|nr:hypothetical protein [candidate division WOR-3 bacterium]